MKTLTIFEVSLAALTKLSTRADSPVTEELLTENVRRVELLPLLDAGILVRIELSSNEEVNIPIIDSDHPFAGAFTAAIHRMLLETRKNLTDFGTIDLDCDPPKSLN